MDTLTGWYYIKYGMEAPDRLLPGMIQSFYDAPGWPKSEGTRSVFQEELHEIAYSIGAEYAYKKLFAVRTGYFTEHSTKGNRKYFTIGAGASYSFMSFDISYMIPTQLENSPLFSTFRFSILAQFGGGKSEEPQL